MNKTSRALLTAATFGLCAALLIGATDMLPVFVPWLRPPGVDTSALVVSGAIWGAAVVLLCGSLWHIAFTRLWQLPAERTPWITAIVMLLFYQHIASTSFACMCSVGVFTVSLINTFLFVVGARLLLALLIKDSPKLLAFYLPVMFGMPFYVNHVIRSYLQH